MAASAAGKDLPEGSSPDGRDASRGSGSPPAAAGGRVEPGHAAGGTGHQGSGYRCIIQVGRNILYQLEVKRWLVAHSFPVAEGWDVTVDIDSMERGIAGQHPPEKKAVAAECEKWLRQQGVKIVAHHVYGRADMVATKGGLGTFVIEIEGDSSRQKEQAMYSALGQIVLSMKDSSPSIRYGLAVPDSAQWETQFKKIPARVRELLKLDLFLVSKAGVRKMPYNSSELT